LNSILKQVVLPVHFGHDVKAREFKKEKSLHVYRNHWIHNYEIIGSSIFVVALLCDPFPAISSIDMLTAAVKGEMDFALGGTVVFHTSIGIINISIPVQTIIHYHI